MAQFTTEIASDSLASDNPIHQRLLKAYYLAMDHVRGDLLELGCGEGRGVELLAPVCDSYLALDKISSAIGSLKKKFPDVEFRQASFPPIVGITNDSYDTIVSFQVIEHIKDDRLYMEEIYRILRPGGKAMITTPNRIMSLTRNPWHIREYADKELARLAKSVFTKVELLGIAGNEKVMRYYEENRRSVQRLSRWDFLNLQYKLPKEVLRVPYDLMNRLNRVRLKQHNESLVSEISHEDYVLSKNADASLDLFCILEKSLATG